MDNAYDQHPVIAEIYDRYSSEFYDYHAKRGDVKFYVDFAIESGGPALEIGCGTGRLLIPTARAGVQIAGIDSSVEMLKICRRKLSSEPSEVEDRATLIRADMRDFNLATSFALVTIPFGPFNYLVSTEEQISCLECIKAHLTDDGVLVADFWYPNLRQLWVSEDGSEVVPPQRPFSMPDGREVTWGIRNTSVDYNRQIIHEDMSYHVRYPDGRQEHLSYPAAMRYFFRYEVEHLLARTGFRTESVYAGFGKEAFGDMYPSELIIVAHKQPQGKQSQNGVTGQSNMLTE